MLCPYCSERDADSRDEVFTKFLGGRAWIAACTHCNSTFGHSIEAAALGPAEFDVLPATFRHAAFEADGLEGDRSRRKW